VEKISFTVKADDVENSRLVLI